MTSHRDIPATEASKLFPELTAIVARACAVIDAQSVAAIAHRLKPDQSPVTAADEASEAEILRGLERLLPGVPVVSEEMADRETPPALSRSFIMVDPLDGTMEFRAGSDEFTVNLAIVTGGVPVAGIVAAPKRGALWRGIVGSGAERLRLLSDSAVEPRPIRTRCWPKQGAVAAMSRSHLDPATQAFLDRLGPLTRRPSGSAIKFCHIAEGTVDVYPRLATTCEWDIAAGHALLVAAGGVVMTPQGAPLPYGRVAEHFHVPAFIAWGDPTKAATVR